MAEEVDSGNLTLTLVAKGFFGATPDLGPFAFLLRRGTPLCFCGTPLRDAEEGEIGPPRGRARARVVQQRSPPGTHGRFKSSTRLTSLCTCLRVLSGEEKSGRIASPRPRLAGALPPTRETASELIRSL